jgi:hypothetical protein
MNGTAAVVARNKINFYRPLFPQLVTALLTIAIAQDTS